ncbi:probable WRKY transcription factor 70 isoform X2 [Hevea brasiliensis]|uniref:probable WRKY transcription factor 70 isoform X2 n=1 Tax=Hevea brasiliensis TaxID=3981 RepID=UPI0025D0BB9A|nr:probable WRKY transcription factor 70 isoform X2 [Hevea brasiliensis]
MESCWPEHLPSDRKKAIDELMKGREFAKQLKVVLCDSIGEDGSMPAEDLVVKILNSFTSSLSILNRAETDEVSQFPASTHVGSPCWDGRKSEDSGESSKSTSTRKDRRGCYKRRNYFRCTHKFEQGCQATKQVQRTEEEPPMYRTTYYGHHTCKNLLKASHLFLDAPDATDSSMLLSFGNGRHHHLTNKQDTPFFSSFQSVKQENNNELPNDHDHHLTHNQSSSSDYLLSPEDHLSTLDPADVISGVNSSCTTSTTTHRSLDLDMIVTSVDNHFDDDDVLELEYFDYTE